MTENQIYRIIARFVPVLLFFILMAGCSVPGKKLILRGSVIPDYWSEKKHKIPPHKKRGVIDALEKVRQKSASGGSLESLGISTLKEAVVLLEEPKAAAPFIADAIACKNLWNGRNGGAYYWKFRYWCVDMAGYLNDEKFAEMLFLIASGNGEKDKLRVRAVKSLREMKARSSLKKLFLKTDNPAVREETAKALLYLD
ncbi:MAG: hypothetical protein U9O97_04375 [Elusimicrobiota bacterium]|nr:hypothetical protein [Elusimicrobiota bacterium]